MSAAEGRQVLLVLATSAGGVGRHVAGLLPGLAAAGWRPRVAAPRATLEHFGLPALAACAVVEVPAAPHLRADARAVRALRALLRDLGARDVVHAHGVRAGLVALAAVRTVPAPRRPALVVTLHNAVLAGGARGLLGRVAERLVARGADVVLAVSPDLAARARAAGARGVERALVPAPRRAARGVDGGAGVGGDGGGGRAAVRAELGAAGAPLVLTVARLAPQKGLPLLLDALGLLRDVHPAPVAAVAGDGPLRAELAARAQADGLAVRWLGARSDVPELLAAADVVVGPSAWEGQPLLVQEALRAGAALVLTDVGGVRDLVGEAAVLVPYGDPQALASAVRELLADPAARAELSGRALARAARLPSEADAVAQVTRAYAQATGTRRPVG
ncbi:glycosyltransferase family 4 protein [Kineococcus sp. NUM-3379]